MNYDAISPSFLGETAHSPNRYVKFTNLSRPEIS